MDTEALSITLRSAQLDHVIEQVRRYYLTQENVEYPAETIKSAFVQWFEWRTLGHLENAAELLTTPHLPEAKEFARVLEKRAAEDSIFVAELFEESKADQYTGFLPFSPERVAAVVQYLAHR